MYVPTHASTTRHCAAHHAETRRRLPTPTAPAPRAFFFSRPPVPFPCPPSKPLLLKTRRCAARARAHPSPRTMHERRPGAQFSLPARPWSPVLAVFFFWFGEGGGGAARVAAAFLLLLLLLLLIFPNGPNAALTIFTSPNKKPAKYINRCVLPEREKYNTLVAPKKRGEGTRQARRPLCRRLLLLAQCMSRGARVHAHGARSLCANSLNQRLPPPPPFSMQKSPAVVLLVVVLVVLVVVVAVALLPLHALPPSEAATARAEQGGRLQRVQQLREHVLQP
jgi:hypothetical protein